jgi:quercetin dioxygenase-like cupin family protein
MRWTLGIIVALAACPASAVQQTAPSTYPRAQATPILRTAVTSSGQRLRLPRGRAELVGTLVIIPPGALLPIHRHPWSRFAYVEEGTVRVHNADTRQTRDFAKGEVIVEAVGQWHEGRAVSASPVRLVVFDLVPPGVNNVASGLSSH